MTYDQYQEKFNALQMRERALALAVFVVLIYALWSLFLGSEQTQAQKQLRSQLSIATDALAQKQSALELLKVQVNADPDQALRQQLATVEADITAVETRLQQASIGLVPAAALARILEQVILQSEGIRLLRIETLPIKQLQIEAVVQAEDKPVPEPSAGVFRHAVKLEVEAGYFALQRYLAALQALEWRFYWDSLHYEVVRYPVGRAELVVYTLSSERGSIGE